MRMIVEEKEERKSLWLGRYPSINHEVINHSEQVEEVIESESAFQFQFLNSKEMRES